MRIPWRRSKLLIDADKRIAVSELEATQFGCNVINAGQNILMGAVETDLAKRLTERGFDVTELQLSEFQRGGGSAKALALRLSDMVVTHAAGSAGVGYAVLGYFFLLWWTGVFAGVFAKKCVLDVVFLW